MSSVRQELVHALLGVLIFPVSGETNVSRIVGRRGDDVVGQRSSDRPDFLTSSSRGDFFRGPPGSKFFGEIVSAFVHENLCGCVWCTKNSGGP